MLGTVFLVVTGGKALYADMGHFGPRPIRLAWYFYFLPALLLNYFGQGSLVLRHPDAAANSFYLLAPSWAVLPLVVLATAASIIASQALISGVYSLTMQAEHMGFLPRLRIAHTSADRVWSDLYSHRQLAPDARLHRRRARFPDLQPPGSRLRYCRDLDHGHYYAYLCRRGTPALALEHHPGGARSGLLPDH